MLAIFAMPNEFPYDQSPSKDQGKGRLSTLRTALQSLDIVGSVLLCLASIAFAAGFSEASSRFAWNSAYVITLITSSGLLWIALLLWERHISFRNTLRQPVLPWQFLTTRVVCGMLL